MSSAKLATSESFGRMRFRTRFSGPAPEVCCWDEAGSRRGDVCSSSSSVAIIRDEEVDASGLETPF
jgi:hypothetical protein